MNLTIALNLEQINNLDLSPVKTVIEDLLASKTIIEREQQLKFNLDCDRDKSDPRELSEIPEVRLWFVRLDACYPWLPYLLNWQSGELARYAAMLVPHQFSRTDGIQYNPEALEIFVTHKIFILTDWLQQWNVPSKSRLKSMAQMFGYELEDSFFELIN